MLFGACDPMFVTNSRMKVNYQIEKFAQMGAVASDFLLATGDRKGWTAHVDYISGWQQDTLDAALKTCPNTAQNDPGCAFHQFSSVIPAGTTQAAGPGGDADAGVSAARRLYKPSPVEPVDGLDHLLVTGEEARRTGFPAATCTWAPPRFRKPPPLVNKAGVLTKSDCGPAPSPPGPPSPPSPPPPPGPPIPPGACGAEHADMDMNGSNGCS